MTDTKAETAATFHATALSLAGAEARRAPKPLVAGAVLNSLNVRSASESSRSTTAVSSASLSWVSRFLPQGNLGGLSGAVCEAVHFG